MYLIFGNLAGRSKNQAGRSKTVRNTYESNSNEIYFQFKRQNLKLFVKLTIPTSPCNHLFQQFKH